MTGLSEARQRLARALDARNAYLAVGGSVRSPAHNKLLREIREAQNEVDRFKPQRLPGRPQR